MNTFIEKFWNGLADKNHREGLVGWYKQHNDDPNEENVLFRNIIKNKDHLALDFGCGPGRNMIKFREWFKRIDGVDISSVVLEKAKDDLKEVGLEIPNLYHINGYSMPEVPDDTYDVVFSIICMQHIADRNWRINIYREINRVLKDNGIFTFQMGYGKGHPISVDYHHVYEENEHSHKDVRVENAEYLMNDLQICGFTNIDYVLTAPCHDQHPEWIWVQCRKV